MNMQSNYLYVEQVIGSRKISNICWAIILLIGTIGFLLTGLSSYLQKDLFSVFGSQSNVINFTPQGLVMSFYGIAGFFLSAYLAVIILFNVGAGYNEFDYQSNIIFVFRWGFPGKNRRIRICCLIEDVEAVCIETNQGLFSRSVISLRLKDKQSIPLNQITESFTFKQLETQAATLAQLLQVPIEGI